MKHPWAYFKFNIYKNADRNTYKLDDETFKISHLYNTIICMPHQSSETIPLLYNCASILEEGSWYTVKKENIYLFIYIGGITKSGGLFV